MCSIHGKYSANCRFNFCQQFGVKLKAMHFPVAVKGLKGCNQVSKFKYFIHSRILMSFNKYMN